MIENEIARRLNDLNNACDAVIVTTNGYFYVYIDNADPQNITIKQERVPQTDINIVCGCKKGF